MNFKAESEINQLMGVFMSAVKALSDAYTTSFKPSKVNTAEVWLLAAAMMPFVYNDAWIKAHKGLSAPGTSGKTMSPSSYTNPNDEVGVFIQEFSVNISFVASRFLMRFPMSLIPGARHRYQQAFFNKLGDRLDEYSARFAYDVKTLGPEFAEEPSLFMNLASCAAGRCVRRYKAREGYDGRLLLPMSVLSEYYVKASRMFLTRCFGYEFSS